MALRLYQQFQQELNGLSIQSLLDLYCGVGAFAFFAEKHCEKIVGVEISDAAIAYANKAREKNTIRDITFAAMDVEQYLKNLPTHSFDAIVVNPPRRGLNSSIVNDLIRLAPNYLFI